MTQEELFPVQRKLPAGFVYRAEFISAGEEAELVTAIEKLEFSAVKMRGVVAKRRTAHFGRSYDFESFKLGIAPAIPDFLLPLQDGAAELIAAKSSDFGEALVTEYPPGAGIGWHRDAPAFGVVVGISLLADCTMQFRRWPVRTDSDGAHRKRNKAVAQLLARRSCYVLAGEVRTGWQHHIPPIRVRRYSITFRTLRGES